jgi:RNA polymerase sigma factor (sigma-70 family)
LRTDYAFRRELPASRQVVTMGLGCDISTRATLLGRLYRSGAADHDAWREFVDQYGCRIYRWCRHWQLQEADAEDVSQRVLVLLLAKMKDFVYDPARSFRAWLKTITHHAWRDLVTSRQYAAARPGSDGQWERLLTITARDDLVQRLEEEFDRELLQETMFRVRLRVAPHKWEAFRLSAIEGIEPREVARRLDMKTAHVYAARSKIQRLIRAEIEQQERGENERCVLVRRENCSSAS